MPLRWGSPASVDRHRSYRRLQVRRAVVLSAKLAPLTISVSVLAALGGVS